LTFARRKDWSWIAVRADREGDDYMVSTNAQTVLEALIHGGAQFVDELQERCHLLETQVTAALAELAGLGLVSSDHFSAFRRVLPHAKHRRTSLTAGRWFVLRKPLQGGAQIQNKEERIEKWAAQLLARYGIVFRDLLERETLATSWAELVRVYRRMEARGEIRGGLFITGVSGEQFGHAGIHHKLLAVRKERALGKRHKNYAVISS